MKQKNEIILYQPDETVKLEVRLEEETVWLTQAQMAELFVTTPQNITCTYGICIKRENWRSDQLVRISYKFERKGIEQ